MPEVPYSNTRLNSEAPIQGQANTQVSQEALGGGQVASQIESATKNLTTSTSEIAARSYVAAAAAATTQRKNQIENFANDQLYGGVDANGNQTQGLVDKIKNSGQDAHQHADDFYQNYQQQVDKISADIPDDQQRVAFQASADQARRTANRVIQTNLTAEQDRFEKQQYQDSVTLGVQGGVNGYSDPDLVKTAHDNIMDSVQKYGLTHGWSDQEMAVDQSKALSQMYQGATEKYFANNQDQQGRQFYNSIKDQVTDPKISVELDKLVQEGSLRGDAQRGAVGIVSDSNDMNAAMSKVMAIKDPKLQDATRERVEPLMRLKASQTQQSSDNNFLQAMDIAQKTGNFDQVPLRISGSLTQDQKDAVTAAANNTNGSAPIKTNASVKNKYTSMDPQTLAKVTPAEIASDVRPSMSDYDFKNFTEQWQNSRAGVGGNQAALAKVTESQLQSQDLVQAMGGAGISGVKPGDTMKVVNSDRNTRLQYDAINAEVQKQIVTQQEKTGKPLSRDETKTIMRNVVSDKVFSYDPQATFFKEGKDTPLATLTPEQQANYRVRVNNIPPNVQQAIYQRGIQSGGIPASVPFQQALSKYKSNFEKAAGALHRGETMDTVGSIMGEK